MVEMTQVITNVDLNCFKDHLSYCMGKECRKKTNSNFFILIKQKTSKGFRYRLKMKCVVCRNNKSAFVKEKEIIFLSSTFEEQPPPTYTQYIPEINGISNTNRFKENTGSGGEIGEGDREGSGGLEEDRGDVDEISYSSSSEPDKSS